MTRLKLIDRKPMAVTFWARSLMEQHGLISEGWSFRINSRLHRTLGRCNYTKKLIELSGSHVQNHSEACLLDTMMHEIAHALVGRGHGHGNVWQAKAIELGANPSPCKAPTIDGSAPVDKRVFVVLIEDMDGSNKLVSEISKIMYNKYTKGTHDITKSRLKGKSWTKGRLSVAEMNFSEIKTLSKFGA